MDGRRDLYDGFKHNHVCSAVCVCVCARARAVDSGVVHSVSSVSGLLRQQWFNLTDAGGTDRRRCVGQVMISHTQS